MPHRCPALAVVDLELVAVKASFHGKGTPAVDALIPVVLAVALGFGGFGPTPPNGTFQKCASEVTGGKEL